MTVRYTVILDEQAVDNMEWLRVTYGLKTKADVIDLARTVLTWMTEAQIQDYEVGRFCCRTKSDARPHHDPIPPINRVRHLHVRTTRNDPAMPTDTLTEAVANMESAWRRLREVLDGPDVAAALVEASSKPRPMSTAPLDGTAVMLHFKICDPMRAYYRRTYDGGPQSWGTGPNFMHNLLDPIGPQPIGWSPVK